MNFQKITFDFAHGWYDSGIKQDKIILKFTQAEDWTEDLIFYAHCLPRPSFIAVIMICFLIQAGKYLRDTHWADNETITGKNNSFARQNTYKNQFDVRYRRFISFYIDGFHELYIVQRFKTVLVLVGVSNSMIVNHH